MPCIICGESNTALAICDKCHKDICIKNCGKVVYDTFQRKSYWLCKSCRVDYR